MRVLSIPFSELNRKTGRVMATWLIWRVRENASGVGGGAGGSGRPETNLKGQEKKAILKGRRTWKPLQGKLSKEPRLLVTYCGH